MIKTETLSNGFIHTWTDDETKILKNIITNDVFTDAVDDPAWNCQYEEIDVVEDTSINEDSSIIEDAEIISE